MKSVVRRLLIAAAVAVSIAVAENTTNLLVFTKTAGYRHLSIPHGIELINSIAKEKGWSVTATEDSSIFTAEGLSPFNALVFISTTGNMLNTTESEALHEYMFNGGGWLGIHAAGDFGNNMPVFYERLVGAQFRSHPCEVYCDAANKERWSAYSDGGNVRPDIVTILDHNHPSTANLPTTNTRADEWYAYFTVPAFPTYQVLATINETYIDEITIRPDLEHMSPHTISWASMYYPEDGGSGRSFYTGMGHTNESYTEDYFVQHVTGGLDWVTFNAD